MSEKEFINNLSSTYADIRKLDVKKINLKGKNILEYINENKTVVLDDRGTLANDELDIWLSNVSTDEDGNVIVKEYPQSFEISIDDMTETLKSTLKSAVKVENNQVLGADDTHLMFFETNALTEGTELFELSTSITSFESDLSSLIYGISMFDSCTNLTSFKGDLHNLVSGKYMFAESALLDFDGDLSGLAVGEGMFYKTNVRSFYSDLGRLTEGNSMFRDCESLSTFNGDLSMLTDGSYMFYNTYLTLFTSKLGSLTNGSYMFYNANIKLFNCDLSTLTDGSYMFYGTYIYSFDSALSSLTNGTDMFYNAKLDAPSLANILHTLPTHETNGTITIGLGIDDTDEARQAVAEAIWCKDWNEVNQEFANKNWTVTWQYNGAPTPLPPFTAP